LKFREGGPCRPKANFDHFKYNVFVKLLSLGESIIFTFQSHTTFRKKSLRLVGLANILIVHGRKDSGSFLLRFEYAITNFVPGTAGMGLKSSPRWSRVYR